MMKQTRVIVPGFVEKAEPPIDQTQLLQLPKKV